jgi:hypothetical protein
MSFDGDGPRAFGKPFQHAIPVAAVLAQDDPIPAPAGG